MVIFSDEPVTGNACDEIKPLSEAAVTEETSVSGEKMATMVAPVPDILVGFGDKVVTVKGNDEDENSVSAGCVFVV